MFLAPPSLRLTRGWSISQAKEFLRSFSRKKRESEYTPSGTFPYQSSYFVLLIGSEVQIPIDLSAVSRDRLKRLLGMASFYLKRNKVKKKTNTGDIEIDERHSTKEECIWWIRMHEVLKCVFRVGGFLPDATLAGTSQIKVDFHICFSKSS